MAREPRRCVISEQKKDWVNIIFLTLTPIIGIAGTAAWTIAHGFHLWMPLLLVAMYLLVGISICAGYHRFFSHKSYEASRAVQIFYAIFGAMAAQNSILWWSSSHRVHHKYVDNDWDPYNIQRGFWWAHFLWIFYRNPAAGNFDNSPDLAKNPVVMWQHRWHKVILILGGFGLPALVGAMFGDPIAGLLWGGFLRIVIIHHTTFFVNSLAHAIGRPTYNVSVSARDNWAVALLTLGEGYHSFHHRFPSDFRNGIRWYQWDPAKWWIGSLKWAGLATSLRATAPPQIEQARMAAALPDVEQLIAAARPTHAEEVRRRLNEAMQHLEQAFELWRQHVEERARGVRTAWQTRRRSRLHVKQSRRQWKLAMRMLEA
ncbi:MAG: acyl-CoA desaturase [Thermoanaerobaculia bacterium]